MVDAVDPRIGPRIIDPYCGTGGFLIYAFEVVSEKIRLQEFSDDEKSKGKIELSNRCIFGTDWAERTTLAACKRVILAVGRALRLVKPGGTVASVVIDGMLNNDSKKYVRNYIRQNAKVKGIVSLPAVPFEGYHARAKTTILYLEKKAAPDDEGAQGETFMAVASNSGYAANGAAVAGNELPEILLDYKAFLRGKKSQVSPNTWVGTIQDRMGAEFYRQRHKAIIPTQKEVSAGATLAIEHVNNLAAELAAVRDRIAKAFAADETVTVKLADLRPT